MNHGMTRTRHRQVAPPDLRPGSERSQRSP